MNKDLTVGNPQKVLWMFCLPLFGSVVFQQLYNIADSLVAGKFIGEYALAAVGNSYEITLIFIAFGFGCNMGCSVIVSRFYGAKDMRKVRTAVTTAMIMTGVCCAVLMTSGLLGGKALLQMIHTPADIMADSALYLDIYILGLPFLFFYNVSNGIFSALGDSRTPFLFLAISSTVNIGVDILFVTAFQMGVAGVAWATFLCQGASCILALAVVIRRMKGIITRGEKAPLFSWAILHDIIVIAIPSTLQQSFISVGNIILQSVINGFGASTIAGYAAGVKLNNLVITSFTTLGNGVSNYTAQNLGAGKNNRIREGMRAGIRMVLTLSVPMFILYFFFGKWLLLLFMEEASADAMATGIIYLRILSPFYFIIAPKLVADGILRGAGMMNEFMADTLLDLILRVVLAIVFSSAFHSSVGVWCAWPVGWVSAFCTAFYFCSKGSWNKL